MFSANVCAQLKFYVYRLIDPRNGETFYVGKGKGNRVFAHVKGELGKEGDGLTDKLQRIREIRVLGLEVSHVIHRHGLDEATAFEVEAALIDGYPGMSNLAGGRASDERGLMHSRQIIDRYEAKEAVFQHKVLLININQSVTERDSVYEAVRCAWKLNKKKAERAEFVLAVQQGLIVGVFIADEWLSASFENFPGTEFEKGNRSGRYGFNGREAPDEIAKLYLWHRVPEKMRRMGAANPVKYTFR